MGSLWEIQYYFQHCTLNSNLQNTSSVSASWRSSLEINKKPLRISRGNRVYVFIPLAPWNPSILTQFREYHSWKNFGETLWATDKHRAADSVITCILHMSYPGNNYNNAISNIPVLTCLLSPGWGQGAVGNRTVVLKATWSIHDTIDIWTNNFLDHNLQLLTNSLPFHWHRKAAGT